MHFVTTEFFRSFSNTHFMSLKYLLGLPMGNKSTDQHVKDEPIDANTLANTKAVLDQLPDHSRGSKLSDFTKPTKEFPEGLSPIEKLLLLSCTRGEICLVGDGTRPTSATRENKIRASFLRYLILGGCENVRIHQAGIQLIGAFIECRDNTLDLISISVEYDIILKNCNILGFLFLWGAKCQLLNLEGSLVKGIQADRLHTNGSIYLRNNFSSSGIVRFVNAKIKGILDCSGSDFNAIPHSLSCDGAEIEGSIFLNDGFSTLGEVNLIGAKIKGNLTCINGIFSNDLTASNAVINDNVLLDENFQIKGTVDFRNAKIGGNLECSGATFHNKERAMLANKASIKGNVILGDCNAAGGFSFQGAEISGDFSAQCITISAKKSFEFRNANIAGTLHWRDIEHAPGMLDLGGATVKTINMDKASWQKPASIKLNNFTYQGFSDLEEGTNSDYWKSFLEQQPKADLTNKFRPKPYEHLANVLQGMGFEQEAKNIRIERQKRQTEFMSKHDPDRFAKDIQGNERIKIMHLLTVFWRKYISGFLVDYGYRPGNAIIYLIALIFIGTGIYWHAAHSGIMAPTHPLIYKEATNGGFIPQRCAENWVHFPKDIAQQCADAMPSEYSEFQSFIYAADVALPIVNLRMENDWSPRVVDIHGNPNWHGWWVRTFEWFLIAAGWMLSLLFASAVGGIIRR